VVGLKCDQAPRILMEYERHRFLDHWLPVIATLSGAIVAGTISLLVHWLSNRHATHHTKLVLAEERARWAIERRLDRLQNFYGTVEKLLDATIKFRVQQAWQATSKEYGATPPDWVLSYDDARGGFEDQLGNTASEMSLLDEDIQAEFKRLDITWLRWLLRKADDDGAKALVGLEDDIRKFQNWLSQRYRRAFEDRVKGADHTI